MHRHSVVKRSMVGNSDGGAQFGSLPMPFGWKYLGLLVIVGLLSVHPIFAASHSTLDFRFDDPAVSWLYFPEKGAGAVLTIPAHHMMSGEGEWNALDKHNAVFPDDKPEFSPSASFLWHIAIPLDSTFLISLGSGTNFHWNYDGSRDNISITNSSKDATDTVATFSTRSHARLAIDYRTTRFAATVHRASWSASLGLERHVASLVADANFQGNAQGSLPNSAGTWNTLAYSSSTGTYNGEWNARYTGSSWSTSLSASLFWFTVGIDFPTGIRLQGKANGIWNMPAVTDPLTGAPLQNRADRWQSSGDASDVTSVHREVRAWDDQLLFSIPRRFSLRVAPDPRFQLWYAYRQGEFGLKPDVDFNSDPYAFMGHTKGTIAVQHQALAQSQWQYGYLYAGALWVETNFASATVMQISQDWELVPEAGLGLVLGDRFRVLAGSEILPDVRLLLGVQYAL